MEAKNRIALLPRQTVIRNLAALRPRRSWSANRAYRRALVLRLRCGVRHVQSQSENGVRMGSPISVLRQTIKRLRPQIFLFRRFSLGPRPTCGWYSILLNRSLNLDLHALAWAIRSVTHLALACFVSRSFAPFSWTRCFRTTSHAQPRFTTGSRKSSVPAGVHSVRRALVRAWPTGLSRPTLCRLTGRSNRRKNFLVRRCSPVASGSHL
jgi:hypothetical protein